MAPAEPKCPASHRRTAVRSFLALAVIVLALVFASPTLHAATFVVTAPTDEPDADPGDGTCASAMGDCTLRAAIQEANALAGHDGIMLTPNVYELTVPRDEPALAVTDDLDVSAPTGDVIVDGTPDLFVDVGVTLAIDGVRLRRGSIDNAGSLFLARSIVEWSTFSALRNEGTTTIDDSTIQQNFGTGAITSSGTMTIATTSIIDNSAMSDTEAAGGLTNSGTMRIDRSVVAFNEGSDNAGGIVNTGDLVLTNTTVSDNSGDHASDGGIRNLSSTPVALRNVTVTNNVAAFLGVGGLSGPATLRNSILAANFNADGNGTGPVEADCRFGSFTASLVSEGHNVLGEDDCELAGDPSGNVVAADPGLDALADNGGPTHTHALLPDSPARDAGDPATPGSGGTACEPVDQRNSPRPGSARCDVGAFEAASCGDGVLALGEACDDGNTANGDCCSSSCTFESSGSPCTDTDECKSGDVCDGAGTCTAGTIEGCGACESCEGTRCIAAPRSGCHEPTLRVSGQLEILRARTPRLTWRWPRGDATSVADFGDPLADTHYAFCLFDESGPTPRVAFRATMRSGSCGKAPCWKKSNHRNFAYKDTARTPDGVDRVWLKSGVEGKAGIEVFVVGPDVRLPMLPLALPARIQLQADDGRCWDARYLAEDARKNDAKHFNGSGER